MFRRRAKRGTSPSPISEPTEVASTDDLARHDSATNDSATNDSATNDSATNDSATNDSATNDSATNDSATNDSATNDSATNDSATNERAVEGVALAPSDHVAVDVLPPARATQAGHDSGLAAIEAEFNFSEEDQALLAPPLTGIDATLFEHRERLSESMIHLNHAWSERAASPTCFEPYFMVPERCWESPQRIELVEILGLAPTQPWNVLPLAVDAAIADRTGICVHPGIESYETASVASTLIAEALEKMQADFERATFGSDAVDASALEAARAQAKAHITGLARRMAAAAIGADAVDHARSTFFGD